MPLVMIACIDGLFGSDNDEEPDQAPTTGALAVTTQTDGEDLDSDGYKLILDNGAVTKSAERSETVYFTGLPEGTHNLEMDSTSVADNCAVEGDLERNLTVAAGDTTETSYEITCLKIAHDKIVFTRGQPGSRDIYIMDPDGSNLEQLTLTAADERYPAISNDGTRIAFYSDRDNFTGDLFIMRVDGSNVRQVTDSGQSRIPESPSWSPDDRRLAFHDSRSGNYEIYTIRVDGTGLQQVTSHSDLDLRPSWSSDNELVFRSTRTSSFHGDIFKIKPDGSGLTRLTQQGGTMPRWSPDGESIAFTSYRDGNNAVFTMNDDGTGIQRVTGPNTYNRMVAWSPDGNKLVFVTTRDGNREIYKIDSDGVGNPVRITNHGADDDYSFWSPVE